MTGVFNKRFLLALLILGLLALLPQDLLLAQGFYYQTALRDAQGKIISEEQIDFKVSIISGSISGPVHYAESHNTQSDYYGIVSFNIGEGSVLTGQLGNIDWSSEIYFVKLEMDREGDNGYIDLGTTQILAVPMANYANVAGQVLNQKVLRIEETLRLQPSNPPENPQGGDMYFDQSDNVIRVYDGSIWRNLW